VNSAIVLPQRVFMEASPVSSRPSERPSHVQPRYVYGDSTPFPIGVDFIAMIRAVVAHGVALMKAQHAIDCARARVNEAQENLLRTQGDLGYLAETVERALSSRGPRTPLRDASDRVVTMTRGIVVAEVRSAQQELDATVARAEKTIVEARRAAAVSFGELLARYDLPGSTTGFRLFATDESYGAEVVVNLPGGLRATFDAKLPEGHEWQQLRRVRHAREDVTVTLRREVGWFSRRIEPVTIRLDALTVLGASMEGSRGALLLGKSEKSGVAHAFDVDFSTLSPRVKRRDTDDESMEALSPKDATSVARLLRAIGESTRPLVRGRRAMTDATFEGRPLGEVDPGDVCERLVALIAPQVCEIGRRSGAPGELVLRRNVDAGHRDEIFVTTAELLEQIETLPPSLRSVFMPLELGASPRSHRAPARSLATYEEISACEILPVA
jgi:hypothetical protein